jgi:hypothetical protein
MWTVQAPHWPWSHPFFDPVRCRSSRRQSSSVVRGSIRKSHFFPFTRSVTGIASFDSDDIDCFFSGRSPSAGAIEPAEANKPAMPKRERKVRRVDFPNPPRLSSGFPSLSLCGDMQTSAVKWMKDFRIVFRTLARFLAVSAAWDDTSFFFTRYPSTCRCVIGRSRTRFPWRDKPRWRPQRPSPAKVIAIPYARRRALLPRSCCGCRVPAGKSRASSESVKAWRMCSITLPTTPNRKLRETLARWLIPYLLRRR